MAKDIQTLTATIDAAERELSVRASRIRQLEDQVAVLEEMQQAATESLDSANQRAQYWRDQFDELARVHRAELELADPIE